MPTLFQKIMAGEILAEIIYEDEWVVAFKDISPQAPFHVLLVPREPIVDLSQAADKDSAMLGRLFIAARNIARKEPSAAGGFRLVLNNGKAAGQEVPHLHVHMLAGREMGWPPG